MKNFARLVLGFFFLSVLLLSFQNCASYSENSLFESKSSDIVDLSSPSLGAPVFEFQPAIDLRDPVRPGRLLALRGQCYTGGTSDASLSLTLQDGSGNFRNLCGSSSCTEIRGVRCNQGSYVFLVPLVRAPAASATTYQGTVRLTYRSSSGGVVSNRPIASSFVVNILD
jgi:hypothetical protein